MADIRIESDDPRLRGNTSFTVTIPDDKVNDGDYIDRAIDNHLDVTYGTVADFESSKQASPYKRLGSNLYKGTIGAVPEILNTIGAGLTPFLESSRGVLKRNLIDPQVEQFRQGSEALSRNDPSSAFGHTLAGLLPGVGPVAAKAGEEIGSGDVAGGIGTTLTIPAQRMMFGAASKAITGDLPNFSRIGTATKGAYQGAKNQVWGMDTLPFKYRGIGAELPVPRIAGNVALGSAVGGSLGLPFGVPQQGAQMGAGLGLFVPPIVGAYRGMKRALNPPPEPYIEYNQFPRADVQYENPNAATISYESKPHPDVTYPNPNMAWIRHEPSYQTLGEQGNIKYDYPYPIRRSATYPPQEAAVNRGNLLGEPNDLNLLPEQQLPNLKIQEPKTKPVKKTVPKTKETKISKQVSSLTRGAKRLKYDALAKKENPTQSEVNEMMKLQKELGLEEKYKKSSEKKK